MNEVQLSKRLEKVVTYISPGSRIADIGSDHAYLPCYAVNNGLASYAIAGEVVKGPYESARQQVAKTALTAKIDVRFGDGLAVIDPTDNIDTIVIAGMGGALIRSILEAGASKLMTAKELVLQPNVAAWQIRDWAEKNHWKIVSEAILREDNKIYEVLHLKRAAEQVSYNESEKLFGPCLLQEKNTVFREKWLHEKENWQKIGAAIRKSAVLSEANKKRLKELENNIQLAEEVLK